MEQRTLSEIEKLNEAIKKLRTRKDELTKRFKQVLNFLNTDYESALGTLDTYIDNLKKMIEQLKNPNTKHYFGCLLQYSKAENFIVIPNLSKNIKVSKFKVFRLEDSQGLLRGENVKKCSHQNSCFYELPCGKVHCLKCLKDKKNLQNVTFEELLNFKEDPIIETSGSALPSCECGTQISRRDLLIIRSIKE